MKPVKHYWQQYLQTLTPGMDANQPYLVEQFEDIPQLADELGQLVIEGTKTATCSALWEWEAEQLPLPTVGLKTIVLDGGDSSICIIEMTEVNICPFNQVDAQFAYDEGEIDCNGILWERFAAHHQGTEINHIWPHAHYMPDNF